MDFQTRKFPITLLLDNITGDANIGSIFRLADAFGVSRIIFTGTRPNLDSNRLKKTARNTHNSVSFEFEEDPQDTLRKFRALNYQVVGLEITSNSIPFMELDLDSSSPIVLVAGNERHGISQEVLNFCDKVCHIEMFGENSSMNVAQSVGIALYELTRSLQKFRKK